MKLTLTALTSLLSLTTLATAQDDYIQYPKQSKPFALVAHSKNPKYNNRAFVACHEGAAIEGLCIDDKRFNPKSVDLSQTFRFNTSRDNFLGQSKKLGKPGFVIFNLPTSDQTISSTLGLSYSDSTNVAVPLFMPGDDRATNLAFDSSQRLNLQYSLDDTVTPPTYLEKPRALYRWFVCETYAGYQYTTLAWVMGEGEPQNPSCVKVEVRRVFL